MESRIGRRRAAARSEGSAAYVQRRAAIVHAAAKVFKDKGFGGANLVDVAAELGADRASIYYYFASKEELFQDVVRDAVTRNVEHVEQLRDAAGGPADKLAELIEFLLRSYAEHYPFLHVYIQEDMSRVVTEDTPWARETRDLNARFSDAMVAIVQTGIEDGSLRRLGSPEVVAYGLLGMVNWTHRWFDPDGPADAETIAKTYAEIVLDGLRP